MGKTCRNTILVGVTINDLIATNWLACGIIRAYARNWRNVFKGAPRTVFNNSSLPVELNLAPVVNFDP
jgi:hypothetical protein